MAKGKLTPKQRRFVEEYLISLNATAAAEIAGFKQPVVQGSRLLGNVNISTAIQRAVNARSKRTEVTQDRVLREVGRIAFFNPKRLFDDHGNLKDLKDIDDADAAAISSIKVVRDKVKSDNGEVTTIETVEMRFWNKNQAIELASKHTGGFVERKEFTGKDGGPIETRDTALSPALREKLDEMLGPE